MMERQRLKHRNDRERKGNECSGLQKVLFITSYYSGLRDFVEGEESEPHGMPAISMLWRGLGRLNVEFDQLFFAMDTGKSRSAWKRIPRFGGKCLVREWRVTSRWRKLYALLARLLFVLDFVRREDGYDIIYVDRAHIIEGAILASHGNVPVVVRLHGVTALPEKLASPGANPVRWVRRLAYGAPFSHIISSDDGSPVRPFISRFCSPKVPTSIWLNGVPDFSEASEQDQELEYDGDGKTVLFLSRLDRGKGVLLFVEAMEMLLERCDDCYGMVVGDGPLWDECVARSRGLERLRMVGSVPHDEVEEYYREATIFVSLSDVANLNNTVLEALRSGVCIVTYGRCEETGCDAATEARLADAVHFVKRGITPTGLADVLEKLLSSPELRARYRSKAMSVADDQLEPWSVRIRREVDLLEQIASAASSS